MRTRLLVQLIALGLALPATAQEGTTEPERRITAIRITGNDTTQERVIRRELALGVGDVATAQALADTRQAIQDLGLFRRVVVEEVVEGDQVLLVVAVREKRYLLPIPRLDGNSDGDYSYGAQLRWSNLWGLNHRMVAYVEQGEINSEADRDRERSARVSYTAPYVWDTPWTVGLYVNRTEQVTLDRQERAFDENFHQFQALASYDLRDTRPRRGWILGGGVFWQHQETRGQFAPPPDGHATALVATAEYQDFHFNLYSQTGKSLVARAEYAGDGWLGSDYGYERLEATWRDYRAFGSREHQTVHFIAAGGVLTGGPRSRNAFELGGSSRMRGYDRDSIRGDSYWYLSGEYLRPLRWDWLRLLANVEVAGARRNVFDEPQRSAYASVGLGLRARITWFVDIEIEAGVAMPLVGGDGPRFFASTL